MEHSTSIKSLKDSPCAAAKPAAIERPCLRVCIVLPGLGAGGTEHVVNVLANQWAARGWSVTLLTFEPPDVAPYYRFVPDIEIRQLGLPPKVRKALGAFLVSIRRVRLLRRAMKEIAPDVVFSFLSRTNVLSLIAARGLGVEVVVSERNNPARQEIGPVWRLLRAKLYPSAFGLVTMTPGALRYFPARMRKRSWVIPNPVDLPENGERQRAGNTLAAVGRLVPQKGFDLLLRAFARVSHEFPNWNLVIWGEGPERAALEAERTRLGLDQRVDMPGVTARPGIWVDTADVFVLSSRFEGWGIVLLEAMAAGLPVISFDCQFGPREMIENGEDGILVEPENVDALAEALRRVLGDEKLRTRLGKAAGSSAGKFTPQRIVDEWDKVALAAFGSRRPLRQD